jgi:hypothetical protein
MRYNWIINQSSVRSFWNKVSGEDMDSRRIRQLILKLVLNPNAELRKLLLNEKRRIFQKEHRIGLQLRLGSIYSDYHESYRGIPVNRLGDIIEQVDTISRNNHWRNVELYISTDSKFAVEYIANLTRGKYEVVESKLFERGHTGYQRQTNTIKKMVSDMYYIFVSWQSSIGRLICDLVDESKCGAVLNWWNENKQIPIPDK